jgi:hypothetical protein
MYARLLLLIASCLVPPLTDSERGRLDVAADGRPHHEPAFAALLENTARWTGPPRDEPVRLAPDISAMMADADAFRGELCRIEGVLASREALVREAHEGVEAWFVRLGDGRPVLVFVDFKPSPAAKGTLDVGDRVGLFARYYKVSEPMEGADGRTRQYAAFVGALPERLGDGAAGAPPAGPDPWRLVGLVVILGGAFVVLRLAVRRRKPGAARPARAIPPPEEIEEVARLPDDPAAALAVLRRRASEPE